MKQAPKFSSLRTQYHSSLTIPLLRCCWQLIWCHRLGPEIACQNVLWPLRSDLISHTSVLVPHPAVDIILGVPGHNFLYSTACASRPQLQHVLVLRPCESLNDHIGGSNLCQEVMIQKNCIHEAHEVHKLIKIYQVETAFHTMIFCSGIRCSIASLTT